MPVESAVLASAGGAPLISLASHVLISFPPHAAASTGAEETERRAGVGDQSVTKFSPLKFTDDIGISVQNHSDSPVFSRAYSELDSSGMSSVLVSFIC